MDAIPDHDEFDCTDPEMRTILESLRGHIQRRYPDFEVDDLKELALIGNDGETKAVIPWPFCPEDD